MTDGLVRKIRKHSDITLTVITLLFVGIFSFFIIISASSRYSTTPQVTGYFPDICTSQASNINGEIDQQCSSDNFGPKDKIKGFPFIWSTTAYNANGTVSDIATNKDLLWIDLLIEASGIVLLYLVYAKFNKKHI
jgi:hypothetical protein